MKPRKPAVIAVVGSKSSGKTTLIEILTHELTKRGYRVAAVKHVPDEAFTIDTEGKDTWRFTMAGAKTVIAVSPKEIATIEKMDANLLTLKDIVEKCLVSDVVIVEGFRKLLGMDMKVPKIVTVKSTEEAAEAMKAFKPIMAFAGFHQMGEMRLNAPYLNLPEDSGKLTNIVEEFIKRGGNV